MFEFELPDLGEGVAEGELLEWHVAPGDRVAEDDLLAEVETDKAAVDVPSPVDGTVAELRYDVGDVVAVGEVIVTIEEDDGAAGEGGEEDAAATEDGAPASGESGGADDAAPATGDDGESGAAANGEAPVPTDGRIFAPPSVRRLARELGVDLTTVEGSGPSGRIQEGDVRAAAEREDESGSAGAEEADDDELKSAVSRVAGGDGESASESGSDAPAANGEKKLKSAVSRVGESDDGEVGADQPGSDESGPGTEEPAVKAAVSAVGDASASAETRDRTLATPSTRQVARDLGVDLDAVPTEETRDGEPYVSEAAVREYADEQADAARAASESSTAATAGTGDQRSAETDAETAGATGEKPTRREPYRGLRRTIGEQMQRSRSEVPHATHHDRAVVPELVAAKERLDPLAEDRGVNLTYLPFVLKSVAAALREHPILNTELDAESEEIVFKEYYDLGVATATDAGLVVPVVEGVGEKGILELAADVDDLVSRARDRSIDREEMRGGTFTVTNFGAIGGEYADPVINVPETAVLATGRLRERPVARDGEVVAEPTLPLSLAIDHRVIDGADAARFANTLKEYLADPTLLLLE